MSIEAMRQALEALRFGLHVGFDESSESQIKKGGKAFDQHSKAITALRTAIERADEQEPAPGYCKHCKQYTIEEPLPAVQRQWVGLTDEELNEWTPEIHGVIQAIEAKLKEKNT